MSALHNPSPAELTRPGCRPFEPLAPVLVAPNAQEIFAVHPEIEELHKLPVDLFDAPILTDEALKNNGVSREERRGRASDSSMHEAAQRAVLSAAHVLYEVPEPAARQDAYGFLVHEWEQDRQVQADNNPYLRITLGSIDINDGVAYVAGVNNHSRPVQQRILEQIGDSTSSQYQFLKLLASVQSRETLDDLDNGVCAPDKQALRWLTLLSLVRADRQRTPIAELLYKRLNDGEFDHYMARDMLEYAGSYDIPGTPPEPVATLKGMISLVEHSSGAPADGQVLARMAEGFNLGMWVKEQQAVVYKQRKVLLETLDFLTATVVAQFTAGVIRVEGRDYKQHLYKSFDDLADIESGSFFHQAIQAVGETAVGHLKRRHQPRAEEAQPAEPEITDSPEQEPIPLMCVDSQGSLHAADSTEFAHLVQSYLDKHKNTPHLKEDLAKILDYLSRLNFGNGAISGLIRVSEGYAPVALNGHGVKKALPVWEFKPKEAQGLSLRSNAATRTRIFLSVLPGAEALAIRDIGRRTDSNARALNKRSGRRRRH